MNIEKECHLCQQGAEGTNLQSWQADKEPRERPAMQRMNMVTKITRGLQGKDLQVGGSTSRKISVVERSDETARPVSAAIHLRLVSETLPFVIS